MLEGSADRHHLVPRCKGGRETEYLHLVCHRKLHSTFTEKQLAEEFNTVEALLGHEQIARFVEWVKKRPPEYCDKNDDTKERKRKRKR